MEKITKHLLDVTRVHPGAQDIEPGVTLPAIFNVGDLVTLDLISGNAVLTVLLDEIHGSTLIGAVGEGSTDSVGPGDRVSFVDPDADHA